jgi:hypothetical protein
MVCSVIAAQLAAAQEPVATDLSSSVAKESVWFDGQKLNLAWQGENPGETIKEFVPAGQTLKDWTTLASIREYDQLNDVHAVIGSFVKTLKAQYPDSPIAILENPTTGDVMLDFVVWPKDNSFVEFNIFKYHKRAGGGLVAEQLALRAYGEQPAEDFLKNLKPLRKRLLEEMAEGGLQRTTPTAATSKLRRKKPRRTLGAVVVPCCQQSTALTSGATTFGNPLRFFSDQLIEGWQRRDIQDAFRGGFE